MRPAHLAGFPSEPERDDRPGDRRFHHLIWAIDSEPVHVTAGALTALLIAPDGFWVRAGTHVEVRGRGSVGVATFDAASCPTGWARNAHLMLPAGLSALLEWLPDQLSRPWAPAVLDAVGEQLAIAQARVAVSLPLPSEPGLRRVALALLHDPSDQRGIDLLARDSGFVERTFRRRFAAETGVPFSSWRTGLRLQTAMAMLDAGETVDVVARRCGYSSRAGFTRAFKAATGLPPSAYRRVLPAERPLLSPDWPLQRAEGVEADVMGLNMIDTSAVNRRASALAAAGMLLLSAACSDTDREEVDATDTEPVAESASESSTSDTVESDAEADSTGATESMADEPDQDAPAADADASPCESGFRLFDHDGLLGDPTCIPAEPTRVVGLGFAPAELMLVAGVDFIGGVSAYSAFLDATHPEWVETLAASTEGLADVFGFSMNIESVAAAEPDLIVLTAGFVDAETTELLREVAPTVEFDLAASGADWRAEFRFAGDAMNVSDQVETLIADADRRMDDLASALGSSLEGATVSVVRARPGDALQLRLGGSSIGLILERLGVARPPSQQIFANDEGLFTQQVSQELWAQEADADYVFLYANQPGGANEQLLASIQGNPLWGQLAAVQNGQAYPVGSHWHSAGVLSEHKVIDDLYELLLGVAAPASDLAPRPPGG